MKLRFNHIRKTLLPNRKLNIFIMGILFLGLTCGAIFSTIINRNDTNIVIEKIKLFISNINTNSLNSFDVLKSSLSTNLVYLIIIFLLGITIVGVIINISIVYFKGFILGFSLASFIITFRYRGIALSILYLIFGQLLSIVAIIILATYSVMISSYLLTLIFKNRKREYMKIYFKKYLLIFLLCIFITIISSFFEAFILPALIKIVIKLYI